MTEHGADVESALLSQELGTTRSLSDLAGKNFSSAVPGVPLTHMKCIGLWYVLLRLHLVSGLFSGKPFRTFLDSFSASPTLPASPLDHGA